MNFKISHYINMALRQQNNSNINWDPTSWGNPPLGGWKLKTMFIAT
jgi:hypothetical protein